MMDEQLAETPQLAAPTVAPVEDKAAQIRAIQIRELQRGFAEQRQSVVMRGAKLVDDFGRSVASGATLGGADEYAALMESLINNRDYSQALAEQRARDKTINPIVGMAGEMIGGAAIGALTAGVVSPATLPLLRTIKFAALGATEGFIAGFLHGEGDAVSRSGTGLVGAAIGAPLGAAAPVVTGLVVRGLRSVFENPATTAAQRDAAFQIGRALQKDELTPEEALRQLQKLGPQGMVADIGGNVAGTARASMTVAGPGRKIAEEALTARSVSAPDRARAAVVAATSEKSANIVRNALIANRAAAARPLYEEAFKAGPITSLKINELLEKSADVKSALAQARRLPEYAELPDNHIILLDKAYKNIGGKYEAARRAGDKEMARDLNNLRLQLQEAIVEKVPVYGKALDKFKSESDLVDALDLGKNFIREEGDVLDDAVRAMSEGEREQFTIGVARALVDRLDTASDGVNAARRIFGNKELRDRIALAFPTKEGFDQFERVMMQEAVFGRTKQTMLAGSPTINKEREVSDLLGETGFAMRADAPNIIFALAKQFRSRREPATRELAKMLFTPGQAESTMTAVTAQELQQRLARRMSGGTIGGALGGAGASIERPTGAKP